MSLPIHAVDLSHYQAGNLDLAAAKRAGVQVVFHKATESTSYVDPNYARRRAEVKAAGLIFGAYHFMRPGDGKTQARHFMATAKLGPGDMWPVLDYEVAGLNSGEFRDFVDECKRLGAPGVILYTYASMAPPKSFGCPLWIARYSNSNTAPAIPTAWRDTGYWLWQFSDGKYGSPNTVPGIGHCDINTLGRGKTFDQHVWPKPAPAPAPKPTPARVDAQATLPSLRKARKTVGAKTPKGRGLTQMINDLLAWRPRRRK